MTPNPLLGSPQPRNYHLVLAYYLRGTQQPFSVKYLFGEANIA